jgi:signal transduction histidine kinase
MEKTKSIHSLNRKLMIMVIGFITVFIIISSVIIANLFIEDTKQEAAKHTQEWADFIAKSNSNSLINDTAETMEENLGMLLNIPLINQVHILKVSQTSKSITCFGSYIRVFGQCEDTNIGSKITELSIPKFNTYTIELIVPIILEKETHGYVYIQVNTKHVQETINAIFSRLIIAVLLLFIFTFLVATTLNRFISNPMSTMANKLHEISQQKKFNLRIEKMPYKELDILARNINIMLSRAEKQLAKLSGAKQLTSQQNLELEEKISRRTKALKDSNQELLSTLEKLHQFQGQLVESEKMASLGDMVAGVAHEVNTPIGLGVTASTLLSDRLLEIKSAFNDKTLKSSHLKKFLIEGEENTAIIYRNLKRAAKLIANFKKVAVDQSNEERSIFNIKHLLDGVLLTLEPQIKHLPFNINIECPPELEITSQAAPISQIVINLILNSIAHGFDGKDHGVITINVTFTHNRLNIDYQDDGKGIEPSIINKVFDPFTTTKRGSGASGLGLHLVYNLVTQALDGKISFSSEIEKGVNFKINFPILVKHSN